MSPSGSDSITLCAVGDISPGDSPKMIGTGVRSVSEMRGGGYFFTGVEDLLAADVVFGNLEGVLSDHGYRKNSFRNAQLRGVPSMAQALRKAGFNILNVANNHMMQYGERPFQETCALLSDNGMAVVGMKGEKGWQARPVVLTVQGRRLGFLGYADPDRYGHEPCYALNRQKRVLDDVRRLKGGVDTLVVSLHWGDEFVRSPSPAIREYARAVIDAGADILLGHHPHVVQNVERYSSGWICYSLGNFVSDMVWNPICREGLLVRFGIAGGATYPGLHRTSIDETFRVSAAPLDLPQLAEYVETDEGEAATAAGYRKLAERRRRENRNLAHLYLLKNFFRYPPPVYLRIWLNSLGSVAHSLIPARQEVKA